MFHRMELEERRKIGFIRYEILEVRALMMMYVRMFDVVFSIRNYSVEETQSFSFQVLPSQLVSIVILVTSTDYYN